MTTAIFGEPSLTTRMSLSRPLAVRNVNIFAAMTRQYLSPNTAEIEHGHDKVLIWFDFAEFEPVQHAYAYKKVRNSPRQP
jgi:hypothetical protein